MFLRLLSSVMAMESVSVGSSCCPASGDGVFPADADRCIGGSGMIPSIWEPEALRGGMGGRVPKWPAEKLGLCWCGGGMKPNPPCCWGCDNGRRGGIPPPN